MPRGRFEGRGRRGLVLSATPAGERERRRARVRPPRAPSAPRPRDLLDTLHPPPLAPPSLQTLPSPVCPSRSCAASPTRSQQRLQAFGMMPPRRRRRRTAPPPTAGTADPAASRGRAPPARLRSPGGEGGAAAEAQVPLGGEGGRREEGEEGGRPAEDDSGGGRLRIGKQQAPTARVKTRAARRTPSPRTRRSFSSTTWRMRRSGNGQKRLPALIASRHSRRASAKAYMFSGGRAPGRGEKGRGAGGEDQHPGEENFMLRQVVQELHQGGRGEGERARRPGAQAVPTRNRDGKKKILRRNKRLRERFRAAPARGGFLMNRRPMIFFSGGKAGLNPTTPCAIRGGQAPRIGASRLMYTHAASTRRRTPSDVHVEEVP